MPPMCHHITTRYTCGHSLLPSPEDPPCTRSCAEHRGVLSYFKAKKTGEICPACRTGKRLLAAGAAQELLEWDAERGKATGAAGGGGGRSKKRGRPRKGARRGRGGAALRVALQAGEGLLPLDDGRADWVRHLNFNNFATSLPSFKAHKWGTG